MLLPPVSFDTLFFRFFGFLCPAAGQDQKFRCIVERLHRIEPRAVLHARMISIRRHGEKIADRFSVPDMDREAQKLPRLDPEKACAETELSGMMEGLYIKVEEGGRVADRMKFVRAAFLQCVDFSEKHWIDKPIIPNQLAVPVDALFV